MPKREDEFWAGMKEGRGRGLCPFCGSSSIYYNRSFKSWRCVKCEKTFPTPSYGPGDDFGKEARWFGKTTEGERRKEFAEATRKKEESKSGDEHLASDLQPEPAKHKASKSGKQVINRPIPNWLIALSLVFSVSIIGIGTSIFARSLIPLWLMFGFCVIYSIEKWFYYFTRRYKSLGKLYRLLLNCSILSLLALIVWTGVKLFSQELSFGSLLGSLIFIAEFILFIWIWRIVAKNSWRWPSMKLTVFSLIALFLVLAFAGVEPMSTYKDATLEKMKSAFSNIGNSRSEELSKPSISSITVEPTITNPTATSQTATPIPSDDQTIKSHTGVYKNYYLGLVNSPQGNLGGSGCYDDEGNFIVLINNKNATNPTYSQLVNFLQQDKTDEFPYTYTLNLVGIYYGTAESHVDLNRIKDIIDGVAQPSNPGVCADFAERLHNNAEMAGIRCAYVSVDITGYSDPYRFGIPSNSGHACNAFQTIDRGLIYVDATGMPPYIPHPSRPISTVTITVGQEYIPIMLFPEVSWEPAGESMGTVTNIFMTWDGIWNN